MLDKDQFTRDDDLGSVTVSLDTLRTSDSAAYQEALTQQGSLVFSVSWSPLRREETQRGSLFVKLRKASGLKPMDRNGFSDPYAKLALCGVVHKSSTIKRTLDPVWDETFSFHGVLRNLLSEPMQLHLWDQDTLSRDDKLGHASVELRDLELAGRGMHELSVRLQSDPGVVSLQVWWVPDGSATNAPSHVATGQMASPHAPRAASGRAAGAAVVAVPVEVRATFNHFDANRSGYMDFRELVAALRHYGFHATQAEAAAIVRRYDDSPDGKLDIYEFATLVRDISSGALRQHEPRGRAAMPPRTPASRVGGGASELV